MRGFVGCSKDIGFNENMECHIVDIDDHGLRSTWVRSGLVEEGIQHFQSIGTYGAEAREEHYTCMVDLLTRPGKVKEVEEFMKKMPFEPTASAWGALLSGCRDTREIKLGLKCAEELF
ncbi:hypothetical protein GIB67_008859, partial [Kingdonia uniflora]